jgi:heme oxygenase
MTLLDTLRSATGEAHQALHVHPLLAPLTQPDLSLRDYQWALLAFEVFYRDAEAKVHITVPESCPNAPVLDWLEADMAAQNLRPLDLNAPAGLPIIDSPAGLMGYLYTKQGSGLGGGVMSKALKRVLGLEPLTGQHFFAGYGPETGQKWQIFIDYLFASAPNLSIEETVEMAIASFRTIAAVCDAVLELKYRDAIQTARGVERGSA